MEGISSSLLFLVMMIAIFYFMLIRPQKRQAQERKRVIDSMRVGDEPIAGGGLFGTIGETGDDEGEVETAPGSTVRFVKAAIVRRLAEDETDASATQTPLEGA